MAASRSLNRFDPTLMANAPSNITSLLARCIKWVVVALLVPLIIGLVTGALSQLEVVSASGATFRDWVYWGFGTYVGLHVLLYRPVGLFRASHRLFSTLAVWLFGGQVSSVEQPGGGKGKGKGPKGEKTAQGSTLVAFSPYVIPSYTILVCVGGWLAGRWWDRAFVDGPVSFLIGVSLAFHWLMTADELQQQRSRWHVETYLLAIGLVFVLTLLITTVCLPWAIPDFSFVRALADGLAKTQATYTTVIQRLFL